MSGVYKRDPVFDVVTFVQKRPEWARENTARKGALCYRVAAFYPPIPVIFRLLTFGAKAHFELWRLTVNLIYSPLLHV